MCGKINVCWLLGLFCTLSLWANDRDHLLPKPQQYTLSSQSFKLDKVKVLSPVLQNDWKDFIAEMGGSIDTAANCFIEVRLVDSLPEVPLNQHEAYRLEITTKRISIEATTENGVFMAMQTIRQLYEKKVV